MERGWTVDVHRVAVRATEAWIVNLRTRMPFRYGIATMEALPHLVLRASCDVGRRPVTGWTAEHLPPKWFTKDPETSYEQDLDAMLDVVEAARALASEEPPAASAFEWWLGLSDRVRAWAREAGHPPLLAGLGVSLVERCVIDACCRHVGLPFHAAVRDGTLGIRLSDVYPELRARAPADLLAPSPRRTISIRHTVGLADILTGTDRPDGLPMSLSDSIEAYGLRFFKVKVSGHIESDIERLSEVARVVGERAGPEARFTLDGNEQFRSVADLTAFWEVLLSRPELATFTERVLFVEQPLRRDVALTEQTMRELRDWAERPPIIIDESDGHPDDVATALDGGYVGSSHKNCKGVFAGVAKACLLAARGGTLSGEDLTTTGPIGVQQDLAVMSSLGVEHVERNGHHYFLGLRPFGPEVNDEVLDRHPDLYQRHPRGFATMRIVDGTVDVGSVVDAPFGTDVVLPVARFTPVEDWSFASLGLPQGTEVST